MRGATILRGISSSLIKQVARKTTAMVLCYAFLGANMQAATGEVERAPQHSATWISEPLPVLQNLPATTREGTRSHSSIPTGHALQREPSRLKPATKPTELATPTTAPLGI